MGMKRIYEQPLANLIELAAFEVIAVSVSQDETGVAIGSGTVNPDEAWADESRNAWFDIWGAM